MAQSRSRSRIRHEQRCKLPRDKRKIENTLTKGEKNVSSINKCDYSKKFHNPVEFELLANYFLLKLHVDQSDEKLRSVKEKRWMIFGAKKNFSRIRTMLSTYQH